MGPWTWNASNPGCHEVEFAHAAVIPVGSLAGYVLMWKNTDCGPGSQVETWVFEPPNPTTLVKVPSNFDSNIFCSDLSWDWQGNLLVTGGVRTPGYTPFETYRFSPLVVGGLKTYPIPPCGPCNPKYVISGTSPWEHIADMSVERYYPTLVPLNRLPLASNGVLAGTSTPVPPISGSGHLVLGGPPNQPPVAQTANDGNDLWQVFDPVTDDWTHTLIPNGTNPPFYPFTGQGEEYQEKQTPPEVEELLDTYPRAFQLADPVPLVPNIHGQIFVVNDVDTALDPPNTPGKSWVIKPPYAAAINDNDRWELWQGRAEPLDPGDCTGSPATNCYKDRYYGTAVLMHTLEDKNRVLVFGGSQLPNYPASCPTNWRVNSSVWEHGPGTGANPVVFGNWTQKTSLNQGRLFLNAIVLPTGQILITGGSSVDSYPGHNDAGGPCTSGQFSPAPVDQPELYDPGARPFLPSSTRTLAAPAAPATPRLYHHLAVLLPDGSVFVAGGAPESPSSIAPYSGEIFYPPYLSLGTRPEITSGTRPVSFSTSTSAVQFDIDVTVFHPGIAKVVLLRPAALTHHCDMDQRYIELEWQVDPADQGYPAPPPTGTSITLNVTSPEETLGPAGYYMLFVVEVKAGGDPFNLEDLIPSSASFLRLKRT